MRDERVAAARAQQSEARYAFDGYAVVRDHQTTVRGLHQREIAEIADRTIVETVVEGSSAGAVVLTAAGGVAVVTDVKGWAPAEQVVYGLGASTLAGVSAYLVGRRANASSIKRLELQVAECDRAIAAAAVDARWRAERSSMDWWGAEETHPARPAARPAASPNAAPAAERRSPWDW